MWLRQRALVDKLLNAIMILHSFFWIIDYSMRIDFSQSVMRLSKPRDSLIYCKYSPLYWEDVMMTDPRIKTVVTSYCYNFYKEGKAIMNKMNKSRHLTNTFLMATYENHSRKRPAPVTDTYFVRKDTQMSLKIHRYF